MGFIEMQAMNLCDNHINRPIEDENEIVWDLLECKLYN
jgi:hypothetical protein